MALSRIETGSIADGAITAADLASGAITASALPAGSVIQTAFDFETAQVAVSTYTRHNLASVSITPTSTSSTILVFSYLCVWMGGNSNAALCLTRDSSNLNPDPRANANALLGRTGAIRVYDDPYEAANTYDTFQDAHVHQDLPSTTSSITYDLILDTDNTAMYVNRGSATGYSGLGFGRTGILVMEIAG